jgi:hypothetical protein
MGIDIGFDLVPPLDAADSESQSRWQDFLAEVLDEYQGDPVVQLHQLEIEFQVGEHPRLPRVGYAFRRFSSKISSTRLWKARPYILRVYEIAQLFFPKKVQFWDEGLDELGYYGWDEVYDARNAYIAEHQQSLNE